VTECAATPDLWVDTQARGDGSHGVTTAAGEKKITVVAGVSDITCDIDVARGTLPGGNSKIRLPVGSTFTHTRFAA
jgi:hypothetical protein